MEVPFPDTDPFSEASVAMAGTEVAQAQPREGQQCPAPGCALGLRQAEGSRALEAAPWMARAYPASPEGTACLQRPNAKAGEHRHWVPQVLA